MPVFINNQNLFNLSRNLANGGIDTGNEIIDAICVGILLLTIILSIGFCIFFPIWIVFDSIKEKRVIKKKEKEHEEFEKWLMDFTRGR